MVIYWILATGTASCLTSFSQRRLMRKLQLLQRQSDLTPVLSVKTTARYRLRLLTALEAEV